MLRNQVVLLVAAAVAVSALVSAQNQDTGTGAPGKAKIQEAAAPSPALMLPLVGLTKENLQAAEKAVAAIQLSEYSCRECEVTIDQPGECPDCGARLTESKQVVMAKPALSVDKETLTFRLNEGTHLGLAQLDAALGGQSIHVDRKALEIAAPARVVFANVTSKEAAAALEKALKEGKLIQDGKVTFEESQKQAQLQLERTTTPLRLSALTDLGRTSKASWTVADVVWMPGVKAKSRG